MRPDPLIAPAGKISSAPLSATAIPNRKGWNAAFSIELRFPSQAARIPASRRSLTTRIAAGSASRSGASNSAAAHGARRESIPAFVFHRQYRRRWEISRNRNGCSRCGCWRFSLFLSPLHGGKRPIGLEAVVTTEHGHVPIRVRCRIKRRSTWSSSFDWRARVITMAARSTGWYGNGIIQGGDPLLKDPKTPRNLWGTGGLEPAAERIQRYEA